MFDNFDMLAATLVHEIKNPLALVRANLDYIELCDTEKRYANSYTVMKRQLERTDSLLQDFVGLVSGVGQEDEDAGTDICTAIRGAATDYMSKPNLEFVIKLPPKIIVQGNGKLLRIVFSNAIKNAAEAGARHVYIFAKAKDGRIRIIVTDDGPGLTEEALKHAGESGGYTTKTYGNGLGVLISRKIINGCGGTYRIGNVEGGGCEVTIEMPCLK